MHFTSKKPLNIPYYLFRSQCNMVNRVQTKGNHIEASLFHFSLTKLLLIKDLKKKKFSWRDFLVSSGWVAQYSNN